MRLFYPKMACQYRYYWLIFRIMTRDEAYKLLTDHVKSENLVRHCLAVEASMRALARYFQANEDSWGMAGLLHDADWETTRETPERHTMDLMDWLEDFDLEDDDSIKQAILAHNHFHNGHNPPTSQMEWSLFCCDELTGLIVATALVQPTKKLADVSAESVMNKFRQSGFAAGVDRDQVSLCDDKLGISLEEFVGIILEAMQGVSDQLGL